jgi:hypothetical protein
VIKFVSDLGQVGGFLWFLDIVEPIIVLNLNELFADGRLTSNHDHQKILTGISIRK